MKKLLFLSCVMFILATRLRAQGGPETEKLAITPAVIHQVVDSLGAVITRDYIFPDIAARWASYIHEQEKKGAYAGITEPQVLAHRLAEDLQKAHHDGHLRLNYAPLQAKEMLDTTHDAARERRRDSMQLADMRKRNFLFTNVDILPGNIGYVKFNAFVGMRDEARPTITAAFRFVANTNALIIDMRTNGGGDPAMCAQIGSYFFHDRRHWNDVVFRHDTAVMWTDPRNADSLYLTMPVYILTSHRTFSGAEDFTYGMQSLKRATIVGDTTGGGAHPTRGVPVTLGFVASIPFARSLNPYTHTDWEGTGVIPDIPVASGIALEAAQQAVFKDQIRTAANDNDRMIAQWQLDDMVARNSSQAVVPAAVAPYSGEYQGGLVFYESEGMFYCRNGELGNQVFKLYPISPDSFVLDETVHVEFVKQEGKISGLNMHWSNGGRSYKEKVK